MAGSKRTATHNSYVRHVRVIWSFRHRLCYISMACLEGANLDPTKELPAEGSRIRDTTFAKIFENVG